MMLALFRLLGRGLKALGASLALVFARVRDWRKYSTRLRWPLHFFLVALLLAGLAFLNYSLDLERILRTPWPFLRKIWLPLLFLLIYANIWLGRWLWQLLGPDKELSEFPDLDDAWNKAVQALDRAGIDLSSVPLFLVLGRPHGPETGLFGAAGLDFAVQHAPTAAAPLHVWANPAGIWVMCTDASLLGRHVRSEFRVPSSESQYLALSTQHSERPAGEMETFLLKNTAEGEQLSARLRHLCRLIVRDRLPYCPLNGVLLLLPHAATDNELAANQTGAVCERDLQTVEEVLQVHCPLIAVVCDLQQTPGCRDFIERFPEENRGRRLGRRFFYLPEVDRQALPRILAVGVEWIGERLLPPLVYRLLHLGKADEDRASAIQGNRRLYQFLYEWRRRQPHLTRLLLRALGRPNSAIWLSGCYLAATGANLAGEGAFVADIFRQMIDSQNFVAWTSQALAEERAYRRLVRFGYVGLGLFAAAVLALGLTRG